MLVSAVIPVKNAAGTIARTLQSLADQTYRDFETIVVDGGSIDGTFERVQEAGLPNLQWISDPGGGITRAVNLGIRTARGEVILPWLCADDYLDPGFFDAAIRTFADGGCDFAYGNWRIVDGGVVIKSRRPEEGWIEKLRYRMPDILPNGFVFSRSVFDRVGLLDESLRYANDYDFLRRITDAGLRGRYAAEAWYYFQVGGISESRHFECAVEVAHTALRHGSGWAATYYHFWSRLVASQISFRLNRLRKARRG